MEIQREAEIIQLTGWTFAQYDAAPAYRLARMLVYINIKNGIEKIKSESDSARRH